LVRDPSVDDLGGRAVVRKGVQQNLPASCELAAEDAMRAVRLVEGAAGVPRWSAEMLGRVLILEALDAIAIGALKQEADHEIIEAAVHEIIDDCAELRLSAKRFEVAHRVTEPGAMCSRGQVAPRNHAK
jgi:hypothetical protein